ncbi:hypothetical protein ACGFNU_23565 [Spirillospora sp. NPDC048911]|uniref:hypothetical protein n=1 Tax=Spirillospora sp. NPDC048911 TaxID=3364527 RepID=UPI00371DDCEE
MQQVLGRTLGPTGGDWVRDLLGDVAVRRLADVEALLGVGLEPAPGLLQQLQHVPLGYALLDAPGEDLRCTFAVQVDRLVGREQEYAGPFETVLDESADVGMAVDRFADHRIEAPIRTLRLSEQVLYNPDDKMRDTSARCATRVGVRYRPARPL